MSFYSAMKQESEEPEKRFSDSQESLIFSQETYKALELSQGTNDLLSDIMREPVQAMEGNCDILDEKWAGKYDLKVTFRNQDKVTKSCNWTYSRQLKKVYMLMDQLCPFTVSVSRKVPPGSVLSASLVYKREEDSANVPKRCPKHASPMDTTNYNHSYPRHLVRSDLKSACYNTSNERLQVTVPFPEEVSAGATFNFKIMCLNSCAGGIERKPTMIVFTLENRRLGVLGSYSMEVRVCRCPGRDRIDEERKETSRAQGDGHRGCAPQAEILQELKRKFSSSSVIECGPTKRTKLQDQNAETYDIYVQNKKTFHILCGLKTILEYYLPPDSP